MSKSLRDAVVRRPWPALELLTELGPRPAEILRLRFGIDDGKMMTLEQIGRRFKLTRERIRQLENEGLTALRDLNKGRKRLRALYEQRSTRNHPLLSSPRKRGPRGCRAPGFSGSPLSRG
jgi:hypothetical protein